MRTHVTTLFASLSCAAVGLLALPAAGAAAADGSPVLPGDVRAVEQAARRAPSTPTRRAAPPRPRCRHDAAGRPPGPGPEGDR